MTTVLLVEDDPAISEPLARALGREGYDVRAHATGAEALADVRGVDLVVLDLGLPDMDGLDVAAHRAFVGDVELSLTAKEFDLLRVLLREAGSVVARDTLMREVWGSDPTGSTKTLDMHVSWLRRKLGDDATDPHYITTVRGMGFRFENAR